ncbi:MAG: hypothetical protein PHI18_07975 [bacterium]|nr:hypothetical protein [bacterium]
MRRASLVFAIALVLLACTRAMPQDYLRLKDGRTLQCAVLRQDTLVVYTTDWELRSLAFPPLQVYARDEVESIWFIEPTKAESLRAVYRPLPFHLELGGNASMQVISGTGLSSRGVAVLSAVAGMPVIPEAGMELDADVTIPFAGRKDAIWKDYGIGYQVSLNALLHPVRWKNVVPFVLAGGGSARDVPLGTVILSDSQRDWNMFQLGLGLKWGSNGLGGRIEWRSAWYSRQRDYDTDPGGSTKSLEQASHSIRAGIFLYR